MPTHLKPEPHSGGVAVSPDPSPEGLEGVRRRKRIQRLQEAPNKVSKEPEEIPDSALAKPGKWYIRHVYDGDELYYLEGLTTSANPESFEYKYPYKGRSYKMDGKKSKQEHTLSRDQELTVPSLGMVEEILRKFKHQQAHEDLEALIRLKPLNVKEGYSMVPTSAIVKNKLTIPVRLLARISPAIIALALIVAGAAWFTINMQSDTGNFVRTASLCLGISGMFFAFLFVSTDNLFKGNKRWETLSTVCSDLSPQNYVPSIDAAGIERVEKMVRAAYKSKDVREVEKVCLSLKSVNKALSAELARRLEGLDLAYEHVERHLKKVTKAVTMYEEGTDEYNIHAMMKADLERNLRDSGDYRAKIKQTATAAEHMSTYLDTRLALLDVSINMIHVNEIGNTFHKLAAMFADLDTHVTAQLEQGEAEHGLLIEARA